jgi:uncharacterized protein (DUF2141 family)
MNTRIISLRVLLAAALVASTAIANAFELRVEVLNPKSDKGLVLGAAYSSQATWLQGGQAAQVAMEPVKEKSVLVYRNLPAGPYAVSIFHDENGNGKLDSNPAGIPIERYGFSRDARGRMGPPAFADAVVDVQADTTITINLR